LTELPAWLAATSLTAATAIATEAPAAIAAMSAAAVTAEATTTTTTAILAWPRFIDLQHPTSDFLAVELLDRCRRFFVSRHFDEREAFGLSCVAVFNDACRFNRSGLRKQFLEMLAGGLESEISNIEFLCH
jgi:hypothetical protein